MKKHLVILLGILSLSSVVAAQQPKMAPTQSLSIKDLENAFYAGEKVKEYLVKKGFKTDRILNNNDYNEDTVVTSNGKGDKILLVYYYGRVTMLLFQTSALSTAKKVLSSAPPRYQLADSVELAKGPDAKTFFQKRYAYLEKRNTPTSLTPPPPYPDVRFVFCFTNPSEGNEKKQYTIHFLQTKTTVNAGDIVEMSNQQNRPPEISSYEYDRFQIDSLKVDRYIHPTKINPIAPGVPGQMNEFILQHIFNDHYLPLQFLDYSGVQSIFISPNNEKQRSLEYQFNTAGQLTAVLLKRQQPSSERDWEQYIPFDAEAYSLVTIDNKPADFGFDTRTHAIAYEQTIPVKAGNVSLDYNMDTVIAYSPNWLRVYKMLNKTFFLIEEYHLSPESYRNKKLNTGHKFTLEEKDGNVYYSCYQTEKDRAIFKRRYSNTKWELPLTIFDYDANRADYSRLFESYRQKEPGQIVKETRQNGTYTYTIGQSHLKELTDCKVMYRAY
ncbi:hypothetical protein SAMN05660461_0530 [Chitinophaga ginsengisegetis]|uniref:Uncharacterized protein n=1 Tax=Chitinophaga ginsengisegetis TaxID=393003 RepID=A0A1T5N5R1_9BACT|nr:hypothetical protein [Chitinophaga ginsengisegetis]SKC95820.1 hypothetical protein SAMN05660461_0530 [Chitinophaga ginsengisegetis]